MDEPIKERKRPYYHVKEQPTSILFVLSDKRGYKQIEVVWDGKALWIERHGLGAVKVNFTGDVWKGPID